MRLFAQIKYFAIFTLIPISIFSATITINTSNEVAPISPYIYGTNDDFNGGENFTCMRMGGNRLTGYNWENNASNAGTDYYNESDNYMCGVENLNATQCATSGSVYEAFVANNNSKGYGSLVTIPMAGYVAADMDGDVTAAQTAPSSRWHPIYYAKGSPFIYPPNLTDNAVYMDESVNYLVQTFGNASTSTGVKFYDLDNEPGLWPDTHPYLHPNQTTCAEYVTDSAQLGAAIKNVDPNALVFGGVFYGWSDYMTLNGAPDWTTAMGNTYTWFVSYYLYMMNQVYQSTGKKPIDVLDFHYYSEATDGTCRVTDNTCSTYETAANDVARMNATRTLWETGYLENSWIGEWYPQFTPLIPLILQSINTYFPGTKISFSEWNFGAGGEFSGGLTDTDFLGICGKYGVFLATLWPVDEGGYSSAAFKMYRNYDGAKSTFGNTHIQADSDTSTLSVYASINGSDVSTMHIVIVNKYNTAQPANITITSPQNYTSMQVYGFDQTSYTITARAAVAINSNAFTYTMPAYSAMHIILKSNTTPTNTPVVSITPTITITLTKTITPNWTSTPTFTSSPTYTITPTFTITPALVATIIYDGDTAGAQLSNGTVNDTSPGTMTQVTGGDPGNMMLLTYSNVAGYWQQLWWTLNNPKTIGSNLYLTFNIRQDPASPNPIGTGQLYLTADNNWAINVDPSQYLVEGGAINTTWKTVRIPVSVVFDAGQTTVNFLAFAASVAATDNFTVDIDNIRLEGYPSGTPTFTLTPTRTPTYTGTVTNTYTTTPSPSPTGTQSATPSFTLTATPTYTEVVSPTPTITGTPPTETNTPTITPTPSVTLTDTFTNTLTITYTSTDTCTFTPTFTYTNTLTPTYSNTVTTTNTITETPTPSLTITLTGTITLTYTATPYFSPTITPTICACPAAMPPGITNVKIWPNPYNPDTGNFKISYVLGQDTDEVDIKIYTAAFRLVKTAIVSGPDTYGDKSAQLDFSDFENFASGTYYYVLISRQSGKLVKSKANLIVIIR